MTLKSKSSSINGWLIVNKSAGHTSSAIVQKLKWVLRAQKVGHAGTLDPDATGLLPIALGEATKTIPYMDHGLKSYYFTIIFGSTTETDDASGKIIKTSTGRPTDEEIHKACSSFHGNIKQIPPIFSAVKINGQRAYKLAREGKKNLKMKAKDLFVEKLELISRIDRNSAKMKFVCGKGGYVRSIARDLGLALGCFAHVERLSRISCGPFDLVDSLPDEYIFSGNLAKIKQFLRPIESALEELEKIECSENEEKLLRNGMSIRLELSFLRDFQAIASCEGVPVAIGNVNNKRFYPKKVFALN